MIPLVALSLMLLAAQIVNGQDKWGKLAVVLGGSNFGGTGTGSLGGLWQITNRIAVRPEFTINHVDYRYQSGSFEQHTTTTNTGYGISGPITLHRNENLRLYISPRFAYARSASGTTFITGGGLGAPGVGTGGGTAATSASSSVTSGPYSGRISFGGQYALNRHLSVFGETGVEDILMRTHQGQSNFAASTKQSTWQIVTAFGFLLYFK